MALDSSTRCSFSNLQFKVNAKSDSELECLIDFTDLNVTTVKLMQIEF